MDFEKVRSIISAVVLIVIEVASLAGVSISENEVTSIGSAVLAVIVLVYGIWKNHNFTDAAVDAQKYLDQLKDDQHE